MQYFIVQAATNPKSRYWWWFGSKWKERKFHLALFIGRDRDLLATECRSKQGLKRSAMQETISSVIPVLMPLLLIQRTVVMDQYWVCGAMGMKIALLWYKREVYLCGVNIREKDGLSRAKNCRISKSLQSVWMEWASSALCLWPIGMNLPFTFSPPTCAHFVISLSVARMLWKLKGRILFWPWD